MISIPSTTISSSDGPRPIPLIGMGTATVSGRSDEVKAAVVEAIKVGYRHFDTAAFYGTEKAVGEAIVEALRAGFLKSRGEVFITTKLWCNSNERHLVLPALKKSLRNLGLEYVDLYLIHWPLKINHQHIKIPVPTEYVTAINIKEVEMNPLWQQKQLNEFCKENHILLTAYSPLASAGNSRGNNNVIGCDVLQDFAKSRGCSASAQKSSQCERSCGNVTIPFPFGSGEECYHSREFHVSCNRSRDGYTPFYGDVAVKDISPSTGEIEIMLSVAHECYTSSGSRRNTKNNYANTSYLKLGAFNVSTKNRFVAIGCDTLAYIEGTRRNESAGTGCVSTCDSNTEITDGSCSGIGCCKVEIPEGMSSFGLIVGSINNHVNISDFNPCSHAFVVNDGKYNFSSTDLRDFESTEKMPICKEGYEGNPYDKDGCQNINECLNPENHDCQHTCIDTPGSYECKCRKGYSGNGKKSESGCTLDQSHFITITICAFAATILILVLVTWVYVGVKKHKERCLRLKGDERPTMKEVAIELEGILASMIQKHPWVQSTSNEEEGEYLLREPMDDYGYTDSSHTISATFDSMSQHTILPIASGR
ncbi:hypothetical protein L1987_79162 [Smallanthus sonchifolius]|uniref:Uncharacterized protein n=1 Tax=Smallanthus sonchifolius TaxID=185202 RepID=A0ACB8ZEE5_9ASTR|nr:hypothetical protein L1987_79162 [Smallanthus sonchifolius]